MTRVAGTALAAVLILAGCTHSTFHGPVRPVSPGVGAPGLADTVESLTPTFRWKADEKAPCGDGPPNPCLYDFAIWDTGASAIADQGAYGSTGWHKVGPALYVRERLTRPEHTVELALPAETTLFWSVRIRSGDKVSEWGTYDYDTFAGVGTASGKNWRYPFKTPKAKP